MFAVLFDLEGQLDCSLHATAGEAETEWARLSKKYAKERANYSAAVQMQELTLPAPYAAAPAMLAALQKALPLALEALAERATSEDDADRENFAEYQADVEAIKAAIALATATPTGESDGAGPTVETGAPVNDFAGHAATITAAQGYVSNPAGWNAPTPAQVAHLLSLCGISHGPVAADGEG